MTASATRARAARRLALATGVLCCVGSCPPMPLAPLLVGPAEESASGSAEVLLSAQVSAAAKGPQEVIFYGRRLPAGEDFTFVLLPDTQYYSESFPDTFLAQTSFVVEQREALNIAAVFHLGDIVNVAGVLEQWQRADEAISILDQVPDLPYGLCVGNHDQSPNGEPEGTRNFNEFFPARRYEGVAPWYGGHFGTDNDNHYILIDAGPWKFVALFLEYDAASDEEVLAWADGVLKEHSDRLAIVCTHYLMLPWPLLSGFSGQGRDTYGALKDNPNLFLMLGGHACETGFRQYVHDGNVVTAILSDYQCRPNGGDGWLRLLRFSPDADLVTVTTYSPTLGIEMPEADQQFQFICRLAAPYRELGRVAARPGQTVKLGWTGLEAGESYQWYSVVRGTLEVDASQARSFTMPPPP